MYIQKNQDTNANPLIDKYLSIARTEPWYGAKELYSHFGSVPEKNTLIDTVLLPEQKCLCCYCQRSLPNHSYGTIEHIIRQSVPNTNAMRAYFNPLFLGLNNHNICHTDEYISGNANPGQYPHKVAYHNFVMACPMCNNARADQDINPLFLYPNIDNEISYDRRTGEVDWLTDPEVLKAIPKERPTVEKVNLNSSLLKAIRSVWLFGKDNPSSCYSTPDTINCVADRCDLIYRACGAAIASDPNFSVSDLDAFISLSTQEIWHRVLSYKYFKNI